MIPMIFWVIAVVSAMIVYYDAESLGVAAGVLGGGFGDWPPRGWLVACALFWPVFVPLYVVRFRPRYQALREAAEARELMSTVVSEAKTETEKAPR